MVHAYNLSSWKAEPGGPQGQDQLKHIETPCLKETEGGGGSGDRIVRTFEGSVYEKEFKVIRDWHACVAFDP